MGRRSAADRCYIYQFDEPASHTLRATYEWTAPDVSVRSHVLHALDVSQMPTFLDALRSGEAVDVPSVAELGEDHYAERVLLDSHQVRSALLVPLIYDCVLQGFVGLETTRSSCPLGERHGDTLRVATNVIADALHRAAAERKTRGLAAALEHVPVGVAISDPRGRMLWANEAFAALVGRDPEALVSTISSGRPFGLPPLDDLGGVLESLENRQVWSSLVELPTARGGPVVDHVRVFGVHSPDGELENVVTFHEDVTESETRQRQLQEARSAVARASEERRVEVQTIIGEISVGAHRVLEAADLLADTELSPQQRALVGSIVGASRRLLVVAGEAPERPSVTTEVDTDAETEPAQGTESANDVVLEGAEGAQ